MAAKRPTLGSTAGPIAIMLAMLLPKAVLAEGQRQLDAHEHGVGLLNIAVDGSTMAMEFRAPGADVVGFEYPAESAEDRAAVDEAILRLSDPLSLFQMPAAAGCTVVSAVIDVEGGEIEDGHDDSDHDDHENEASHTSFHGIYDITCANPDAVTDLGFAYFESFPNAREVEVQWVSDTGAMAFEVNRDTPILALGR